MRNCLILGCGRSGTSMLAGMLHKAGYFMGDTFHPPRDSNPKGFFEWNKINRINELILAPLGKDRWTGALMKKILKKKTVDNPGLNQRWLMALPPDGEIGKTSPEIAKQMQSVLGKEPYAYKDPRFSYTLPAWKPFLKPDTVFLCIFREPAVTAESILKECRSQDYLADLYITRRSAYRVWTAMYRCVIEKLEPRFGRFLYIHYDQIVDGTALRRLRDILQAELATDFVEPRLRRSQSRRVPPKHARDLYARLCRLAGSDSLQGVSADV